MSKPEKLSEIPDEWETPIGYVALRKPHGGFVFVNVTRISVVETSSSGESRWLNADGVHVDVAETVPVILEAISKAQAEISDNE